MELTAETIRTTVTDWYRALDRHDELPDVLRFLVDDGLEMRFPESTARGHAGFTDWYKAVTNRFFDEAHTVTSVTIDQLDADHALIRVVVNWQASVWNPPAARSLWLGFDAFQTWELVAVDDDVRLKTYIVDSLEPMPGSSPL